MRSEDGSIPEGSAIQRWTGLFDDIGDKLGITFRAAESAYPAITEAGFINVTQRIIKVPLGPWPKDKRLKSWGQWCRYFSLEGMEGFALRSFVDVLGVRFAFHLSPRSHLVYLELNTWIKADSRVVEL